MTESTVELRMVAWNVLTGGIDNKGTERETEERRLRQLDFLSSMDGLDMLWIMEATWWDEDKGARLRGICDATTLTALPLVTSRVGDGSNHSCMYYNAQALKLYTPASELARGSFHHGVCRAAFDADGIPLLVFGAHLAYSGGRARHLEAHHLADYGTQFGGWPEDGVLLMDANAPDESDPELSDEEWKRRVPRGLWHRYRKIRDDGSFGGFDRGARRLLLESGWRDPQADVRQLREPTVGYWYENERVPLRLDQALVTGPRIEVVDYRTLNPKRPALKNLSDHLPIRLDIRLHRSPVARTAV
ncbi:hypothetical protein AQI95_28855 [Streptomyces yokosukanensis]|uniref:Endonuclease/exonuclease/phosphatase domain-containing protein n=1 Tax=Streptomyces yokosukanensis TaxID=67386 RepID=A0A101NZD7_9ACTN|nr:hypothetical protein [Streptomyces yokosukanensis]KUN02090.1 hypothetical protein AQI95_28855 [Streptomyces yokosukanensis]